MRKIPHVRAMTIAEISKGKIKQQTKEKLVALIKKRASEIPGEGRKVFHWILLGAAPALDDFRRTPVAKESSGDRALLGVVFRGRKFLH